MVKKILIGFLFLLFSVSFVIAAGVPIWSSDTSATIHMTSGTLDCYQPDHNKWQDLSSADVINYSTVGNSPYSCWDPDASVKSCCPASAANCTAIGVPSIVKPLPGPTTYPLKYCAPTTPGKDYCWNLTETECGDYKNLSGIAERTIALTPAAVQCGQAFSEIGFPGPGGAGDVCFYVDTACECDWDATAGVCNAKAFNETTCTNTSVPLTGQNWCEYSLNSTQDLCATEGWMHQIFDGVVHGNFDPNSCKLGMEKNTDCGNITKLTFFTLLNLLIVVIVITIIYYVFFVRRTKKISGKRK